MCKSPDWDKLYVNFLPRHIPNGKAHKMNPFVSRPNLCMCVYMFGEGNLNFKWMAPSWVLRMTGGEVEEDFFNLLLEAVCFGRDIRGSISSAILLILGEGGVRVALGWAIVLRIDFQWTQISRGESDAWRLETLVVATRVCSYLITWRLFYQNWLKTSRLSKACSRRCKVTLSGLDQNPSTKYNAKHNRPFTSCQSYDDESSMQSSNSWQLVFLPTLSCPRSFRKTGKCPQNIIFHSSLHQRTSK